MRTLRRRRANRPASAPTLAATIAMFQPEIATTWLTPAVVNETFVIRICVVSHRTHRERVEMALEDIRAAVREVS